jgi:hypothetical protein
MRKVVNILLLVFLVGFPFLLHAQPGFESTNVGDTPVDGGISLLVAAGIGYGVKKLYNTKKK